MNIISYLALGLALFLTGSNPTGDSSAKIGGVSLVAPVNKVGDTWVNPVQKLNAGWVAMLPYAYGVKGGSKITYDIGFQWWGERKEGVTETIRHAKKGGLKVLLKPMVWIPGSWPGGFDLSTEGKWKEWEKNYSRYILGLSQIAADEGVEMICIGTEFKVAASTRPHFWRGLIRKIRKIYPGQLIYAANWDNFENITFWDDLDFIGVDAYFPLTEEKSPSVEDLKTYWKAPFQQLKSFSAKYNRPIVFAEFGYRSVDRCAWRQWELEQIPHHKEVNLEAQTSAYKAFFETFWDQDWFAGVFLWQWYHFNERAGGAQNSDYTPQNKPAEEIIREWYGKSS